MPPLEYHLILRGGRLGLVAADRRRRCRWLVADVRRRAVRGALPFVVWFAADGQDVARRSSSGWSTSTTPRRSGWPTSTSLLASAIPITWLLIRTLHGLKPRWLSSVLPRLRWTFLLVCFGLAFVALFATLLVSALLPAQDTGTEMTGELERLHQHHPRLPARGAVPHPAAGGGGGVRLPRLPRPGVRRPVPQPDRGRVIPAILFALAHGLGQSAPIFFDRLAFGLVAGTLVILTGGLEAGIAMHVLNNWLAFGIALAFGDMARRSTPPAAAGGASR